MLTRMCINCHHRIIICMLLTDRDRVLVRVLVRVPFEYNFYSTQEQCSAKFVSTSTYAKVTFASIIVRFFGLRFSLRFLDIVGDRGLRRMCL